MWNPIPRMGAGGSVGLRTGGMPRASSSWHVAGGVLGIPRQRKRANESPLGL